MTSTMAHEMREQPAAGADTLADLMPRRPEVVDLVGERGTLLFVGRGSSDNSAT
jgi:fructoselysine-6-P-deglycase FrlB-like protein